MLKTLNTIKYTELKVWKWTFIIAAHHIPQNNIFQICLRPQHVPSEVLETPQSNILNFDWPAVWRRESEQGWASLSRSLFNLLQTNSVMFISTIPNSFCETQSVDCYHHIWTIIASFSAGFKLRPQARPWLTAIGLIPSCTTWLRSWHIRTTLTDSDI